MDATVLLPIILYATAIVVLGLIGWGVVQIVAAARSTQRLADELYSTVPGFIERADATLVAFNAELDRVDVGVAQLEEVTGRVTSSTRAAMDVVEYAVATLAGLGSGARRFVEVLFSSDPRHKKHTSASAKRRSTIGEQQ